MSMKTILLIAFFAVSAVALPKPVIHLDVTGLNLVETAQTNNDYVFNCNYGQFCEAPTATAYDHHQSKTYPVQKSYFVIGDDGPKERPVPDPEVSTEAEYVTKTQIIKYDASDSSGNKAEQLVCAFFIIDDVPPSIQPCGVGANPDGSERIEAINDFYRNNKDFDDFGAWDKYPDPYEGCHIGDSVKVHDDVDKNPTLVTTFYFNDVISQNHHINLGMVGRYRIKYVATDFRGNSKEVYKDVEVKDTIQPVITVNDDDEYHECATEYDDQGAVCTDINDYNNLKVHDNLKTDDNKKLIEKLRVEDAEEYSVVYTCLDSSGNEADQKTRKVTVRDTTPPQVTLNGVDTVQVHEDHIELQAGEMSWTAFEGTAYAKTVHKYHENDDPVNGDPKDKDIRSASQWEGEYDEGIQCSDTCTENPTKKHEIRDANGELWNPGKPGVYFQTYTCTDKQNNAASVVRTITVVDKHKPILHMHCKVGTEECTGKGFIEAAPDKHYQDQGASCHDEVDTDISSSVKVMGDVVNAAVPGTYVIEYNCADTAGNDAKTLKRTVKVQDSTHPTIVLNQKQTLVIEASFPYDEPGATAYDSLDGDLTENIIIDGNVDTQSQKWMGEHMEDKQITDTFIVKYDVQDSNFNWANTVERTVIVKDTLPPAIKVSTKTSSGQAGDYIEGVGSFDENWNKLPYVRYKYTNLDRTATHYVELAEEATSTGVNGWIIGAVASAITGLALLGYAGYTMKKSGYASVQSVPV